MINLILEKPCPKCGEEASPTPFSKRSKLNLSLDQQSGMLKSFISRSTVWNVKKFAFILSPSRGLPKYIKTNVLTTCFYFI